ncbi:hypothetical protein LMG23992_00580 [Cupriavidus laharis]|uniref:PAAR domain-containing protein n=1 Tax=Cupriavidus laharis TaxID=151654 RepID=A0ABM8WEH1_9BURK|nr:PAAR domain-containing protein [Cupriavidus laharis]CAG9165715.1 hypothetical protein LMG23992_00580 [Cupriavidus laharis]
MSPRRIITVGDVTDHNGVVATGSPTYKLWGRAVARLHDEVDCPQVYPDGQPHGRNKIIEASGPMFGGLPVAMEGDGCECGCRLIGSSRATIG